MTAQLYLVTTVPATVTTAPSDTLTTAPATEITSVSDTVQCHTNNSTGTITTALWHRYYSTRHRNDSTLACALLMWHYLIFEEVHFLFGLLLWWYHRKMLILFSFRPIKGNWTDLFCFLSLIPLRRRYRAVKRKYMFAELWSGQ